MPLPLIVYLVGVLFFSVFMTLHAPGRDPEVSMDDAMIGCFYGLGWPILGPFMGFAWLVRWSIRSAERRFGR